MSVFSWLRHLASLLQKERFVPNEKKIIWNVIAVTLNTVQVFSFKTNRVLGGGGGSKLLVFFLWPWSCLLIVVMMASTIEKFS